MEEKIPAIKLMHEGSDGHLILLKWPGGIKEEPVVLLCPLSSSGPRVHQRDSGSNLSLFSLFWDVAWLGIQSICLHYLICLIVITGSLYHLLRLYIYFQPLHRWPIWFSSRVLTFDVYLLAWCRTPVRPTIYRFYILGEKHWKSRLPVKWKMMIITSNQDGLVCILQIS